MDKQNTDKAIPDNVVEVSKPVLQEGEVKFLSREALNSPAPTKLKIVVDTIHASCLGITALVSGSNLFTGNQSKMIIFILAVVAVIAGAVKKATGVVSDK